MKKLLLMTLFLLASCNQNLGTNEGEEFKVLEIAPGTEITFSNIQELILAPKCLSCHDWALDENEFNSRIVEGDPESSPLYQQIDSGQMPLGGPELTQAEKSLVYNFIKSKESVVEEVTPPVEELPEEELPEEEIEDEVEQVNLFEKVKNEIIVTNCLSCHNWADDDAELMNMIEPGKPEASLLYQVIESDRMPFLAPPLSDEDKNSVKEMILSLEEPEVPEEVEEEKPEEVVQVNTLEKVKNEIIIPNCLSCHSWANNDFELISMIVPGQPEASLLYKVIANDSMPFFGPPLSDDDKKSVREMILNFEL